MRILQIADVYPAPDSGAAGTEYETAQALTRAGHDVRSVWADELSHHIKHYNLRYAIELPRSLRAVMLKYLSKESFDIVQISQPHGYLAAKVLSHAGGKAHFVHRSHGFEPRVAEEMVRWRRAYPEPRPLARRIATSAMGIALEHNNRGIAQFADGHLVSASECAEFLRDRYDVPASRIAAIAQGIPEALHAGAAVVTPERLNRLLYVGQYAFVKGPMVLGQAVSELLARNPSLAFTWVCSAQHHDNARATLAPAVVDRVTFLGWMPQAELQDVYDAHGIFLFPSFFEGFGKVFIEAMSRGLVVVASRNGGMKDVIIDGVNGFTVETGNVREFVATTQAVIADVVMAGAVSGKAIATARGLHWDRYAAECTSFYERLCRMPKRIA